MKNRCILSLLICGALLYYALPRLSLYGSGLELYFSWMWLGFLVMAIAGNLAAVLYTPKSKRRPRMSSEKISKRKVRSYQY